MKNSMIYNSKLLVVTLLMAAAMSARAEAMTNTDMATVHIPVILGDANGDILKTTLADVNKKLTEMHLEQIPSYIEISADDVKPYDKIEKVKNLVITSLAALGYKDSGLASQYVPGDLDAKAGVSTCYLGNAMKVADLLSNGADVVYTDQLMFEGFKYKTQKVLAGDLEGDELKDFENNLNDESAAWKNYDTNSDTVLILNSMGDDGTDVNESFISKCK